MIADPSVVTKFRIFKVTCRLSVLDTFCPSIKAAVIQMNCYEVVRIRQMIMTQKVFFFLSSNELSAFEKSWKRMLHPSNKAIY